jgi:hypothetical protein
MAMPTPKASRTPPDWTPLELSTTVVVGGVV